MTNSKRGTVRVERTEKFDGPRVAVITRRCLMTPYELRDLIKGHALDIPKEVADHLIARGYVRPTTKEPRSIAECGSVKQTERVTMTLDGHTEEQI